MVRESCCSRLVVFFSGFVLSVLAFKDLPSMDVFGKNDVYVEIRCGRRAVLRTRVLQNIGSEGVFQPPETFQLYFMCLGYYHGVSQY